MDKIENDSCGTYREGILIYKAINNTVNPPLSLIFLIVNKNFQILFEAIFYAYIEFLSYCTINNLLI